jgi:hypothetical protein
MQSAIDQRRSAAAVREHRKPLVPSNVNTNTKTKEVSK